MMIPSIDLMNGQAVQLRRGQELVLTESTDPVELAKQFNRYGEIAVIDLDAAMGKGDNLSVIQDICRVADVRAGGGIRNVERGRALLRAGARQIIIGTAAEPELLRQFPADRILVALDHLKSGEVVDHGWTKGTGESVLDRANRLAPYCAGFLCTFVDNEGGMGGMPVEAVQSLKDTLPRPITVAGGVSSTEDAVAACRVGVDVQVGMALYTGKLDPAKVVAQTLDFEKQGGLIPTVVQDVVSRQVLMVAYSSPESLEKALKEGKGIYFSRSRNELWEKGATSGHTQELVACRTDCDQDSLLFYVKQSGAACHTGQYTCFEGPRFNLPRLYDTLKHRKENLPAGSFSAKLFKDRKFLLRKIMEENAEVVLAEDRRELTWEIADALFFLSVLAVDEGIDWKDIEAELGGRER